MDLVLLVVIIIKDADSVTCNPYKQELTIKYIWSIFVQKMNGLNKFETWKFVIS